MICEVGSVKNGEKGEDANSFELTHLIDVEIAPSDERIAGRVNDDGSRNAVDVRRATV